MLEIYLSFPSTASRYYSFFCWKSASSSSSNFFAGNPFTASFPSVHAKSDQLSRKFGSLSPHLKTSVDPSSIRSLSIIEQFSSKLSPCPHLIFAIHQYWNFVYSSFLCVSKQLIFNIGNSSGHPIVSSNPSVFFCWKSAFSSSSVFLYWKIAHCFLSISPRKSRSAILEIWQSILSDVNAFFSLKPNVVCLASLMIKFHPSLSV